MRFSLSIWFTALHFESLAVVSPFPFILSDPTRMAALVFRPPLPFLGVSLFLGLAPFPLSVPVFSRVRLIVSAGALHSVAPPPIPPGLSSGAAPAERASLPLALVVASPFACAVPGWVWVFMFVFAVAIRHPATTIHGGRVPLLGTSGDVQGHSLCEVCFSLLAG